MYRAYLYALCTLVLWSVYPIFLARASRTHGERPNMLFEAVVIGSIAAFYLVVWRHEFTKVTWDSGRIAFVASLCTAIGLAFFLKALATLPAHTPILTLVAGLYPIGTVFCGEYIRRLAAKRPDHLLLEGHQIDPILRQEVIGIVIVVIGMVVTLTARMGQTTH